MNHKLNHEIKSNLNRTKELIDSKVLWQDSKIWYRRAIFIEVLIHLKDLLVKADHMGKRISFNDDVIPDPTLKINDITDLICNFRDAACHSDSFRRKAGGAILAFNETRGKGTLIVINGFSIGSQYQDDIAFNMGQNNLYLKRHIEKAFHELELLFRPLLS